LSLLARQRRSRATKFKVAEELVYYSLKRTGFKNVRLEQFSGGHALDTAEIQRALH